MSAKKNEPIKIRLAIQGGGAKIVTLLAVLEAIQDLEKEIKVVAIVGTSAGAIAGAFFAAGIKMQDIKKELKNGSGKKLIKGYRKPTKFSFIKLIRGTPLWKDTLLDKWLTQVFKAKGIVTFEDIKKKEGIDFKVVSTDLGSQTAYDSYSDKQELVSALLDSSGLPYLFRVWNSSKNPVYVDGGLCENLPTYLLKDPQEDSHLVAISFKNKPPSRLIDIQSFSMALLDTAISYSMHKTRSTFPGSLYEIDTNIGTFDFKTALDRGLGDHYSLIKNEAATWFLNLVKEQQKNLSNTDYKLVADPWLETNKTAVYLMQTMSDIYNKQYATQKFKYHRVICLVDANCLIKRDELYYGTPDRIEFVFEFEATNTPIHCIRFSLFNTPDNSSFTQDSIHCRIHDSKHNSIPFYQIPVRDKEADNYPRDICLFFDKPIKKEDGKITIRFSEDVMNLMGDIKVKGTDQIGFSTTRADSSIDEIYFVLRVPSSTKISLTSKNENEGRKIFDSELNKYGLYSPNKGFKTIGWVMQDVPSKNYSSVDISII